ncbi:MAG: hypothetical protein RR497_01530 [Oscillospiraceae bacterium]
MTQFKLILSRLKNPSVILSIVSQVITILVLLKVDVDASIVTGIVAAICSIFVLLGIMSNPSTQKISYADDIYTCENCGEKNAHVLVGDELVCSSCGSKLKKNDDSV